ncbi:unnamed protein product [Chondrus crispus]|uniref:Uncharacterized protein n=1 Tax=Chondrus crispus TaxID=2769 RepID=R7QLP9_CHOCR|nr:unnamed protein product [Chondrus crispus]CDF39427.1 unnamed protein product [Chondrus crispus]|eukprot:XP_005719338.1 unnamed protein product [Chondrus crispus]
MHYKHTSQDATPNRREFGCKTQRRVEGSWMQDNTFIPASDSLSRHAHSKPDAMPIRSELAVRQLT